MAGPARLRLTRLARGGVIWDVHVATIPRSGTHNVTQLEFEATGPERRKLRYTRPVEGPLLDALHNGEPVSRASLEEELDHALRDAGAAAAGDHADSAGDHADPTGTDAAPTGTDAAGPAPDHPSDSE